MSINFSRINFSRINFFPYFFKSSFYGFLVIAFGLACSIQPEPLLAQSAPTTPTVAPVAQKAPVKNTPATQIAPSKVGHPQLPGTNALDLAENAQRSLIKLMSEGPCPCDPKKTLLICIQEKSCKEATQLAEYGVQKYKEGLGDEQVVDAVIQKFMEDFVPPANFNLSKTASKGAKDAPIVIVEFADFECPHCAMMSGMLSELVKLYPTQIKVYFKQFPLPFHQFAGKASIATIAAQRQNAFWPMHDLVFTNQTSLSDQSFDQFAQQIGINVERFQADMKDPAVEQQVKDEKMEGIQNNLTGTPTLFFNGKKYSGEPTFRGLQTKINALLKEKGLPEVALKKEDPNAPKHAPHPGHP
jgi:predicted DsbA family dithiol-disulfide isomerase